jgi:hypothetical protein
MHDEKQTDPKPEITCLTDGHDVFGSAGVRGDVADVAGMDVCLKDAEM